MAGFLSPTGIHHFAFFFFFEETFSHVCLTDVENDILHY